ncbi:flagellar basal body rod protein FlgC [Dissulfurirhabdus thermomarina]|uniref:Flagellar basal-body rod protein FlgC n=1 Tax=Dissulfurirhabdus thermomarina TaxID=1765737 RepID=A0A6N9TNK3_DISTH|nr:flagellar basal body rod protein FlgC [Dissulfurirhabdus thermomarina]NDY42882.1 flagellar basal body rod protein FlgC [Dissulfurirhabdus thermomarina]NMX23899.1 flagellar basal body rod protein FlgC [Dissulfurirhabdus thermomarina]
MNLFAAIDLAGAGLSAQRTRLNVATMNLANAQVTRTVDGGPYRPRSVVFRAVPYAPDAAAGAFGRALADATDRLQSVEVAGIVEDPNPFVEVYDPDHPDADADGIVRMPNVDVLEQMVDIMAASRAYEANATAVETAKAMTLKALEIAA